MKALKIVIYQPQSHFRIPFTYQRRHTYPLPPYSTLIGFIINVMGLINQKCDDFKKLKDIKISISGNFDNKITEFIWFRNLHKEAHKVKFHIYKNREINGHLEHPGGQSPILIDILINLHLVIHLWHNDFNFLTRIKSNIENPINRMEVIHLGRSEDWIVYEDIEFVDLELSNRHKNYNRFFWIPESCMISENQSNNLAYKAIEGVVYQLPTFSYIKDYEKTFNKNGLRNFTYINVKLNDGIIKDIDYLYDVSINTPVFLANLN